MYLSRFLASAPLHPAPYPGRPLAYHADVYPDRQRVPARHQRGACTRRRLSRRGEAAPFPAVVETVMHSTAGSHHGTPGYPGPLSTPHRPRKGVGSLFRKRLPTLFFPLGSDSFERFEVFSLVEKTGAGVATIQSVVNTAPLVCTLMSSHGNRLSKPKYHINKSCSRFSAHRPVNFAEFPARWGGG